MIHSYVIILFMSVYVQAYGINLTLNTKQTFKIPFDCNDRQSGFGAGDKPPHIRINIDSTSNGTISYILINKQYCDQNMYADIDYYPEMSIIKKQTIKKNFDAILTTESFCYIIRNDDITSVNINYSLNIDCSNDDTSRTVVTWIIAIVLLLIAFISCCICLCAKYKNRLIQQKNIDIPVALPVIPIV
jgi:hypothetical protein